MKQNMEFIMQVGSIGNTNFGLIFSDNMYKLFQKSKQELIKQNGDTINFQILERKLHFETLNDNYILDYDIPNSKIFVEKDGNRTDVLILSDLLDDKKCEKIISNIEYLV